MLAGDAAAGVDAEPQDLGAEGLDPLSYSWLTGPVKNQRMQIAVAGVEDIGHRQAMAGAEPLDRRQHLR